MTGGNDDQKAAGAKDRRGTDDTQRIAAVSTGDHQGTEGDHEINVPKTTDGPSDTGAGKAANKASQVKVSDSVTHGGTSGHGQGEPVPKSTNIPDPAPDHSGGEADEGNGPAPLGS
ncbi:MAG: hypothetical protein EOP13_01250 [Pseudomonas sp.]|uniref:hypothetical protein n=1 Tax=Pseudomonas sp. TaxID=306 RepID=UPI00122382F6|nr:hypothetical protein [Pseudomonas sp.]RZI76718.1 MAG: hypothetical protein EOP13_01250 [Pseudomonas sp.]